MIAGVWVTPRRLVVVSRERPGSPDPPLRVPRTPEGRLALLDLLPLPGAHLVLVREQARTEPLVRLALGRGAGVFLAPSSLVQVIVAAHPTRPSPRTCATILAALPRSPLLRAHLLELTPQATAAAQLDLL